MCKCVVVIFAVCWCVLRWCRCVLFVVVGWRVLLLVVVWPWLLVAGCSLLCAVVNCCLAWFVVGVRWLLVVAVDIDCVLSLIVVRCCLLLCVVVVGRCAVLLSVI